MDIYLKDVDYISHVSRVFDGQSLDCAEIVLFSGHSITVDIGTQIDIVTDNEDPDETKLVIRPLPND